MKAFQLSDILFVLLATAVLIVLNEVSSGISYPLLFPLILIGYFAGKAVGKRNSPRS